jgi:hypothetical protein
MAFAGAAEPVAETDIGAALVAVSAAELAWDDTAKRIAGKSAAAVITRPVRLLVEDVIWVLFRLLGADSLRPVHQRDRHVLPNDG